MIGVGGYSQVWLAEDTKAGNMEVAIKIYAPEKGIDNDGIEIFGKEFTLVFNLNHAHLLRPMHYDVSEGSPSLVMQYCPNGSMLKRIGEVSEKELARFMQQAASALNYLHNQEPPIIHQDIKPDNFLIDGNGNYLLADFGISSKIRRTLTKSMGSQASTGTLAYMPPEKFSADKQIIKAGDIFSLGVTMYELLTGDLPFSDHGGMVMLTGAQIPNLPPSFNPELNMLLKRCMAKEPWERPTAGQLEEGAVKFLQTGQRPAVGKEATKPVPEPPKELEQPLIGRKTETIPQPQPELQSRPQSGNEGAVSAHPLKKRTLTPWLIAAVVVMIGMVSVTLWIKVLSTEQLTEQARQKSIKMADSIIVEKKITDSIAQSIAAEKQKAKESISVVKKSIDNKEQSINPSRKGDENKAKNENPIEIVPAANNKTGTFTDNRDGKAYKWVQIEDQIWMAENLAFEPNSGTSRAYNDDESNGIKFGYLYDWNTAKKVAPNGWHLPSKNEWALLIRNLVKNSERQDMYYVFEQIKKGAPSGFNALLGGSLNLDKFEGLNSDTYFWSSTYDGDDTAWRFSCGKLDDHAGGNCVDLGYAGITCGMYVRLIKN